MTKAVQDALGDDFKKYHAFSYPTDNFGLITSFDGAAQAGDQICATFSCVGRIPANDREWLEVFGYADVGDGGVITLDEKTKKKIALQTILPKMWEVLEIAGGFSSETTTTTSLDLGPGHVRFLNKLKFKKFVDNLSADSEYKIKYANGDLTIVTSDVVLSKMTVTVEVSQETAINLDAKVGLVGGNKGKLGFNLSKVGEGKYTLVVDHPVIVLRLRRKQPQAGGLGVSDTFNDWTIVEVDILN